MSPIHQPTCHYHCHINQPITPIVTLTCHYHCHINQPITVIVTSTCDYHCHINQPVIVMSHKPMTTTVTSTNLSLSLSQSLQPVTNDQLTITISTCMDIKTITKPCTSTMYQPCTITMYINLYHIMHHHVPNLTIPCTSTMYTNPVPYHVHQPVPCTSTMYRNLYHTMYINHVPYHASTMYHTKYINHVPYHINHKISSISASSITKIASIQDTKMTFLIACTITSSIKTCIKHVTLNNTCT
jgi:hypothetical protein